MRPRTLLTFFTLVACEYGDTLPQTHGSPPAPPVEATGDASTSTASPTTGGGGDGSIETVTGPQSTDTGSSSTGGDTGSTGEAIVPPEILVVDVPPKITVAGPVEIVVYARHASSVRAELDEDETLHFKNLGDDDGDGVDIFSTVLPVFGSVDNGDHELAVIARRDDLEDGLTRGFEIATPAAGVLAWDRHGGPGSRTTRITVDPEGDVFEGGSLAIGETGRPAARRRDPLTGADRWPGGWITLDAREGSIADLALTPEGRLWVAMNVREGKGWRTRIALLEPDMQATGIELETPGATVTALDGDGDGGCFAVGFASTIHGDTDALIWRMSGEGLPIASAHPWDYQPAGQTHKFSDLAFDVVVDSEVSEAWIVGASVGKHDLDNQGVEARGLILRVDTDTFEVIGPPIVAPPLGNMTQSIFYGATLDPVGILVTGNECDSDCISQRIIAARYSPVGVPTQIYSGISTVVAFGSSIARNTHGAILIAANVKDGTTVRGLLLGVRDGSEFFDPLVFPGKEASHAASVAVGPYDWAFCGGQATLAGVPQAYLMRPHQ